MTSCRKRIQGLLRSKQPAPKASTKPIQSTESPKWLSAVPNVCMSITHKSANKLKTSQTIQLKESVIQGDNAPSTSTPTKTRPSTMSDSRAFLSKSDNLQQRLDSFRDVLDQVSYIPVEDDVFDEGEFTDAPSWLSSQPDLCGKQRDSLTSNGSTWSFLDDRRTSMPLFPELDSSSEDDIRCASLHSQPTSRRTSLHSMQTAPRKQTGFEMFELGITTSMPMLVMPKELRRSSLGPDVSAQTLTPSQLRRSSNIFPTTPKMSSHRLRRASISTESMISPPRQRRASISGLYTQSMTPTQLRRSSHILPATPEMSRSSIGSVSPPRQRRASISGLQTHSMTPTQLRRSSHFLPVTPDVSITSIGSNSPPRQRRTSISGVPSSMGSKPKGSSVTTWTKLKKITAPRLRTTERKQSTWTSPTMGTPPWFPSITAEMKGTAKPSQTTTRKHWFSKNNMTMNI